MIKMTKLIAQILSASLILSLLNSPIVSMATEDWKQQSPGIYQMIDGSSITGVYARGVDVSHWQGDIDWSKVAKDDISFVMLGTRYKGNVDPNFDTNAKGAINNGIKLGAYIYSYAMNVEEAATEADFVINLIKDYPISYPVAFDVEDSTQGTLSQDELTAIINTFCNKISDAGYYPIIYANDYWIANKLDMNALSQYEIWVARYNAKHVFSNPCMWQATSTGKVDGMSGNVDIDFQYKDFSSHIPANTWRLIQGSYYYYRDYSMVKSSIIDDGNNIYYLGSDGIMQTGWITVDKKTYYFDTVNGNAIKGWKRDGDIWYYMSLSDGSMMKDAWISDSGKWYHVDSDGAMQAGAYIENKKSYYLKGSGMMATGWILRDNIWYYYGDDGAMITDNWALDSKNNWYYMDNNGKMKTSSWIGRDGKRYHMSDTGIMDIGWLQDSDNWYYLNTDGSMATGMININNINYMLDKNGKMLHDTTITVDGIEYTIDSSGMMKAKVDEAANSAADSSGQSAPSDNVSLDNSPSKASSTSESVGVAPQ